MSVLSKWRKGLVGEMTQEIRHQLRANPRVKGSTEWKRFERKRSPYVIKPLYPILVDDLEETGRSERYHAERVELMVALNELGCDIFRRGDLYPADTETFEGTELTRKEREFITTLMKIDRPRARQSDGTAAQSSEPDD